MAQEIISSSLPKTITIGISGPSSAGKTSLIALLSKLLPSNKTTIIHADAFYKEFDDLPVVDGQLDGEGPDAIDFPRLYRVLDHAIAHGTVPLSPEYQHHDFIENDVRKATAMLEPSFVEDMNHVISSSGIDIGRLDRLIILDGCLLYHDDSLREKLAIKLLLRTSKAEAAKRRFGRYGEKEIPEGSEEFWKTRSYLERFVWPHYVQEHAFLFSNGDVEGVVDVDDVRRRWGVTMPERVDLARDESMRWAVGALVEELRALEV